MRTMTGAELMLRVREDQAQAEALYELAYHFMPLRMNLRLSGWDEDAEPVYVNVRAADWPDQHRCRFEKVVGLNLRWV